MGERHADEILVPGETLRLGMGSAEYVARLGNAGRIRLSRRPGTFLFPPHKAAVAYFLYVAVLVAGFCGICWLKGEPPRWRWGDK